MVVACVSIYNNYLYVPPLISSIAMAKGYSYRWGLFRVYIRRIHGYTPMHMDSRMYPGFTDICAKGYLAARGSDISKDLGEMSDILC